MGAPVPPVQSGATLPVAVPTAIVPPRPAPSPPVPVLSTTDLLSPEVRGALEAVSSNDPGKRAAAMAALKQALDDPPTSPANRALAGRRLQDEIRALVASPELEVRGRALSLLDLNQGLARFTTVAVLLPDDQREALMAWAYSDAGVSIAGRAFSSSKAVRVSAAQELASATGPCADWFLGHLVEDLDREVALTAMDVAGNRKPTPELVEAIFNKSIIFSLRQYGIPMGPDAANISSRQITIHGHVTYLYDYAMQQARFNDSDIATEILIAWNDPAIRQRIDQFFVDLSHLPAGSGDARFRVLSTSNGTPGINLAQLIQAYHPQGIIKFAAGGAFTAARDSYNFNINGQVYHGSSRLDAMALLISATDQDLADYGIVHVPQYGRWAVLGNADAEDAASKKLQAWWKANGAKYDTPGSQPATAPR